MKYALFAVLASLAFSSAEPQREVRTKHLRFSLDKRSTSPPEPVEGTKGGQILEGDNAAISFENPDNITPPSTDAGAVINYKWSFSNSVEQLYNGGWIRVQTVTDLPPATDFSSAQNHLEKGAIREMHWHRTSEWGFVTAGAVLVSAVNDQGQNQIFKAETGDAWYFPPGEPHVIQGMDDMNEYLLIFDDGNFNAPGFTFSVDNWITHTPPDVLAKNFGVNNTAFANTANPDKALQPGKASNTTVGSPFGQLTDNSSYHYPASQVNATEAPGGGGTVKIIDSSVFPIATTLAVTLVEVQPGGMREMHWHPNSDEWLYIQSGTARATLWLGTSLARTFDFSAGDTVVFPISAGHYIENTGNDTLSYLEVFKADRCIDVSLMQWLALSPPDLVSQVLNISVPTVQNFSETKQIIVK